MTLELRDAVERSCSRFRGSGVRHRRVHGQARTEAPGITPRDRCVEPSRGTSHPAIQPSRLILLTMVRRPERRTRGYRDPVSRLPCGAAAGRVWLRQGSAGLAASDGHGERGGAFAGADVERPGSVGGGPGACLGVPVLQLALGDVQGDGLALAGPQGDAVVAGQGPGGEGDAGGRAGGGAEVGLGDLVAGGAAGVGDPEADVDAAVPAG